MNLTSNELAANRHTEPPGLPLTSVGPVSEPDLNWRPVKEPGTPQTVPEYLADLETKGQLPFGWHLERASKGMKHAGVVNWARRFVEGLARPSGGAPELDVSDAMRLMGGLFGHDTIKELL